MYSSFEAIRSFINPNATIEIEPQVVGLNQVDDTERKLGENFSMGNALGLPYHINIVLPESENIAVFNAIFQSLRDNLLR